VTTARDPLKDFVIACTYTATGSCRYGMS